MKKALWLIAVMLVWLSSFGLPLVSGDESREIIAEGVYIMGDGETPLIAEGRAMEQAKRYAVEQAGTYVKSYSRVKSFEIAEDEIEVLASGMMEISILDKKRMIEADAVKFWVKLKATVTPDKINVIVERIRANGISQEYGQLKDAYEKSQAELAKLKEQLATAKAERERQEIIGRLGVQEQGTLLRQLYSDALTDFSAGRMSESLELLERAIAANPSFYPALQLRGFLHFRKGEDDQAISDFAKVLALAPNAARAYAGRGMCYSNQNNFKAAYADLTKALQLGSDFPKDLQGGIHGHLGRVLLAGGNLRQAKQHLQIACDNGVQRFCQALQSPRLKNLR